MSAWLIILTGLIYLYISLEQALKGNLPMAVVYSGYAFSNVGLYILASK
jgi:low temperature requirement protein LtrA